MPKVINLNDVPLTNHITFIGRPSKWGNPYKIGKDGTRKEVIQKFEKYLQRRGE